MSNYWEKKLAELEGGNSSNSSNSSDYWQKRKKELEEKRRYEEIREKLREEKQYSTNTEDIAPVKEDERTWFQQGAFEDGFSSFGNFLKMNFGSARDLEGNLWAGILGMGEKAVDAGAYLVGGAAKLVGADEFADKTKDFIAKDLYDEKKVAEKLVWLRNPLYLLGDTDDSIYGEKTDSLVQSGGQLLGTFALSTAGVPWFLTTGVTSFGTETENAFNQGATYGEAGGSALISAGAEILTEKLFGGIKFGGSTVDDFLVKPLVDKISSKAVRTLVNLGVDTVGEGAEEFISSVLSNLGTALYKEESIGELLWSEEAMDEYLESFIGGAVLGGGMGGINATSSIATGRDYKSGLTTNEQKVVDKVYEERIAEAEKSGEKLTTKEKNKLYDEVLEDLKKGGISTDTIESVLGGDTYKSYQDTVSSEDALIKELEELRKMKKGEMNDIQQDRLAELKAMNLTDTTKRDGLKAQLSESVQKQLTRQTKFGTQADSYLLESYNERGRRGQAFQADPEQYKNEYAKQTVQNALEFNKRNKDGLHNGREAHDFIDLCVKVAEDKGKVVDFTTTAEMAQAIKNGNPDNLQADPNRIEAYNSESGNKLVINMDVNRSLTSLVGHEITDMMRGAKAYSDLQKAAFSYAETKGELETRRSSVKNRYKTINADLDGELTSDLVGDYLFTDSGFIQHLSTNHRNVFQKIYDEIKYLYKLATAGSKEARQLEKLKHEFEKVWRDNGKSNNKASADTKYSLTEVEAVQPSSDKWKRTATTEEAKAKFPKLWDVTADESEVRNPTQISQTVGTYRRIYDYLAKEGFDGTILDASSGLGYGTKAGIEEYGFNVEDIEPYPDDSYKPKYTDYSQLNKKYDAVISSFVLNVLPQEQRDALVVKMGELLNDGGRMFVNVRSNDVNSLAKTGKNIQLGEMEWIETTRGSYQKGFKKAELVAYLKDALGDGFTVEPTSLQSPVAAIVTKNGDVKYSLGYHAGDLGKAEFLFQQGRSRGTGHFGTGTYFVGDEERISGNNTYGKRPHHAVEFSDYNLYKITNNEDGYNLHEQLAEIDGGFSKEWLDAALNDEYHISNIGREAWELSDKYDVRHYNSDLGFEVSDDYRGALYKAYTEIASKYDVEHKSFEEWLSDEGYDLSKMDDFDKDYSKGEYAQYLKGLFTEIDQTENDSFGRFARAVSRLRWRFGYKNTENALREVLKYQEQTKNDRFNFNKRDDSFATVFMKALGYEGIDVRGTRLDNVEYGSVIYDLKDNTIKYSLSDSDGKQLTKEQSEYFKDSKVRDENGNLKVMYHGSQDAGFHTFDANMSDDDTSFFFVDRNDVAASYSGTTETYEAQTIRTAEDMNNFIESIGVEGYEVIEKDGKFTLLYEGDRVADSNTAQGIYDEFCWYEGVGEGDANYKVYLNLTNPLVVDAEGRNWNNVSREFSQEIADRYNSLTADERAAMTSLASWEEISIFRDEIRQALADTETGARGSYDEAFAWNIRRAYEKLGGNSVNMYDLFTIASESFSEDSINQFAVKQMNTRDYAQRAKAEGYDGVIFNNIVDVGGYGNGSEGASTVAIAFDSNQIKSVANEKPTGDADIRYSLSSMANTFFGDENMSAKDFARRDYTETEGYKNYVSQCVNNLRQTRADFDDVSARREVKNAIDGIARVAVAAKQAGYDIYDDTTKRNTKDSKNRLLFSSLEPNSDYFTSNDISTECDKRKNFADIYDAIVKKEEALGVPKGKRFFDNVDNYFYIHKVLADKGLTQPCRECYVESMRKNLAPMANAFLRLVQETDVNNKLNDQLYQPSGKNKGELKSNNAATREWVLERLPEYGMTANDLTIEMLTTEDGLAQLKIQAPMIYEAFNSFYGQSKPKMPRKATPFRFGELTALLTDNKGKIKQGLVDKINSTGGFRLQSYSDFQVQNYTDTLQVLFEAGTLGLRGHAYTKVPAFLEATEGTNLKRNISIFMYKDGNEWKLDRNDSFPYALEEIYDIVRADKSGNTGIIAVSQNADMSAWIMANDLVGYGIPFHKSGLKMGTVRDTDVKTDDGRIIKGYSETKDHTKQQTEVWAKTTEGHKALTKVKKGINIYGKEVGWDFENTDGLTKNELIEKNVKAYIDACDRAGYLPKFREYVMNNSTVLNNVLNYSKQLGFASPDATVEDISFEYKGYRIPYGYYKFLGDFGMFTPDGNASPQEVLSLENYDFDKAVEFFSDSEALHRNEILQQFANGAEREYYRNSDLSAGELEEVVRQKRNEVVDEIVAPTKNSLTAEGEVPKEYGNFNIYAKDIRLAPTQEEIAPLNETTSSDMEQVEDVAPTPEDMAEIFPSEPNPYDLEREIEGLEEQLAQAADANDIDTVNSLIPRYEELLKTVRKMRAEEAAENRERIASFEDTDAPPEVEAPYYEDEAVTVDNPFEERDIKEVGNRKVKAYMYENPEVKPFFQREANIMLGDLSSTTKGERWFNGSLIYQSSYDVAQDIPWFSGTKRHTTDDIAYLLDECKYTYAEIEKGLKAIIEDDGAENNACSKRIEFLLNDRLLNGYRDISGLDIPADQDYINLLNEKQINEYNEEAFKRWVETADNYAPIAEGVPTKPAENIAPTFDTRKTGEIEGQQTAFEEEDVETEPPKIAKILTEEPATPKKKRSILTKALANFGDKGIVFENLSTKTHNRELEAKYNFLHYSESRAQEYIADNLKPIVDKVTKAGTTEELYSYVYHLHNIDRMSLETEENRTKREALREQFKGYTDKQIQAIAMEWIKRDTPQDVKDRIKTAREYVDTLKGKNKPVFDDSVTADASREIVKQLETKHPEFKELSEAIVDYNTQLRKMLVDGNVISQETADLWAKMYPHYVPIRRVGKDGAAVNVPLDTNKTGINAPIKRATGGNSDILPLFDTMALRTEQTFKAIAKNSFGTELMHTLDSVVENEATSLDEVMDNFDNHEELLQKGKNGKSPTFTVFEDGKRVTFEITEDMYDALKPTSDGLSYTNKVANTASNIFRGLLTEYNPVFMATNAVKDVQDVLINSQHAAKTYASIPKALKELTTKGRWYTEYMKNGGSQNTYFDSDSKTFTEEKAAWKKVVGMPLNAISTANNFIERVPRLAEYIASRESGASIETAMLDAARVTTNFAAGGDVTKFLNRNGFTFLNASTQGAMQQVRNVREAKANGLKGWAQLAAKVAIAGLPAILLNNLLWDDDEEYDELSDYVKQNYYVVAKFDDGKFVRIPKGRAVAVIQEAFTQMENLITGNDEVDLESFAELVISNLAPNNPLENNILAPVMQVANNKTWYGEDLVPTRLQDLPAAEQYDESTDSISKWLGEKLNVSPYKINYLLNQYSGGIGDVLLPMITPEAESGDNSFLGNITAPFKDKFTTDSVMKNQNVSDFYDTMDELAKNANSINATDEDVLKYKYLNSVNADLGELYSQKREIQNSDLADDEKYEAVRELQRQIDEIARESLNTYNSVYINNGYAVVGDRYYKLNDKGEWQKLSDDQFEKQEEVTSELGIDPSTYWGNKSEYDFAYEYPEKYAVAKSLGGYEKYKQYTSELYDIKADKDEDGKSISGSRKEKVIDYINNLDADYGEKIILFKSQYNADDTYNYEIIDYLNSREDISYQEMETILKELGFTVDSNGNIYWD